MKIGVFDSGVGGRSVVNAIQKELSGTEIIYVEDHENVPYGTKSPDELLKLVLPILAELAIKSDLIVIACNTVSTTLTETLRENINIPLIAMEPMVKPAAEQTKSGTIAVCATPTTLSSNRYFWLKNNHAKNIKVIEPDCSDWAYMIESKAIDHTKIRRRISEVCERGADVIVLGCTHYHWIEDDIRVVADKFGAKVIQPEQAVIKQIKRVLLQLA